MRCNDIKKYPNAKSNNPVVGTTVAVFSEMVATEGKF